MLGWGHGESWAAEIRRRGPYSQRRAWQTAESVVSSRVEDFLLKLESWHIAAAESWNIGYWDTVPPGG